MTKIIMFGTGHAMVTKCYNTCFALQNEKGTFLVDAGGGNTILGRIDDAKIKWKDIKGLYITHAHTDHILGCIWVVRKINALMKQGKYEGDFNIYGLANAIGFLENSCGALLADSINPKLHFNRIGDGAEFTEIGISFTAFDIHSTKMAQMGFRAVIDDVVLTCLGDEPYNELCSDYAVKADYLMHEAFCLYEDRDKYKPYEKHHSTALDAGKLASTLGVRNLIMYHTEDSDLENRKERYSAEAGENFSGNIYVPMDLEEIELVKNS